MRFSTAFRTAQQQPSPLFQAVPERTDERRVGPGDEVVQALPARRRQRKGELRHGYSGLRRPTIARARRPQTATYWNMVASRVKVTSQIRPCMNSCGNASPASAVSTAHISNTWHSVLNLDSRVGSARNGSIQ